MSLQRDLSFSEYKEIKVNIVLIFNISFILFGEKGKILGTGKDYSFQQRRDDTLMPDIPPRNISTGLGRLAALLTRVKNIIFRAQCKMKMCVRYVC